MAQFHTCPKCGHHLTIYRNPAPTVDVVIYDAQGRIVLVERAHEPLGWALPGGFVDYGETLESAACREANEETGLVIELEGLLGVYSSPERDARQHTITTVFYARSPAGAEPAGGDDAARAMFFPIDDLPPLVFDHKRIIQDFLRKQASGLVAAKPAPGASICLACAPQQRP